MRFVHPEYLWLILALPLLGLGAWVSVRRRRLALRRFAGSEGSVARFTGEVSSHRRGAKLLLVYLALLAAILAAARPQWGTRLEQVTRRGVDLVAVLDTSLSMAAEDVSPSRLGLARHAIDTLLKRVEGDRVGLVTFAGQATLICPLTLDQAAVRLFLDTVDVESVAVAGTSLAEALITAVRALGPEVETGGDRSRAVVLFTDGEDHEGGLEEAIAMLDRAGIATYAVGCGTTRGAPIPVKDPSGLAAGYKKDREGRVVTTRLDETLLEQLALDTGGRYYRATASQLEIDEIAKALTAMDTKEFGAVLRARYEERYQIPLAVALLALLAETVLGDRRRRRADRAVTNEADAA